MAAKLLQSLTDDNQDLQKQIGCMTGIFQLFDRQHMLTGGRRIVGHTPKRLLPGNSHTTNDTSEREFLNGHPISASVDKYPLKNMQDRQRISTESSRASFSSSSRSSSFSSLDCNRAAQLEPASFDRMIFPETPSRDPSMSLQSSSPQFSRQSLDLRDVVKDSMYREVQYSSTKAKTTEDKDKDLPKQRTAADVKESLRILGKLQERPRYDNNEPRQLLRSSSYHSRDGPSFSVSKDAPRFSYDGREINRTPFDDSKTTLKLKDLPRLSLDSREGSMRSFSADSKSLQQSQARPPSVVAKLMGLETLPDSHDTNVGSSRSYQDQDLVSNRGSFEKKDQSEPILPSSKSSKNLRKEPSSPRWRNAENPLARFPIEPAPWKQIDGTRNAQRPASRSTRTPANKIPNTFPSVYSEIEKRLKDLEFTQSGKDLRALKQILEAMQAKGLLETTKEGQDSNFTTQHDHQQKNPRSLDNCRPRTEQTLDSKYESPIVIMKPAKLVGKSGVDAASVISLDGLSGLPKFRGNESADSKKGLSSSITAKDPTVKSSQRDNAVNSVNMKNDRTLKTAQNARRSQQVAKDGNTGSGNSSGSISPRLQQKKLELEKRSRPPTPPDSSKSKKLSNKQQAESNSPGGRRRLKTPISQQSDDQLSEISVESRNLCYHENEKSARSNESFECASRNGEVTSSEFVLSALGEEKSSLVLGEEESADSGFVPPEYSSPISVLDAAVSKDESPSPVKYIGKTLIVDASMNKDSSTVQTSSMENFASNTTGCGSTFEINRKKLQNIENLVQKLRRLNSTHDEARTDYIASLCENAEPEHRYVSEILLASGLLLRDLGSSLADFQFHPSGHPINPELFLVLEQTKASVPRKELSTENTALLIVREKFHRKLIFDTVNEILARKLASPGPYSDPWQRPAKLARKTLNAQRLLRELCAEIDNLRTKNPECSSSEEDERWKSILYEDVVHRSGSWINFDNEVSGAVLDIERMIFKDLVNEIVIGESAGLKTKPARRRRFAK